MKNTDETVLLEMLGRLEEKVDALTSQIQEANAARLDSETVAILTAAAYKVFGRAVSVHNVRLTNNYNSKKINVVSR